MAVDMDPEDIKGALRKRGATLASVARRAGTSKQTMAMAIRARFSERAERAIAETLNLQAHKIWPSRYHANGKRIRLRARSAREIAAAEAAR